MATPEDLTDGAEPFLPGGPNGADLAVARETVGRFVGWPADEPVVFSDAADVLAALRALLADNDHLRRVLHDCGQDGTAKVWAAGYEAGRAWAEQLLREAWLAGFGVGASCQKGIDVSAADAEAECWKEPGPLDPNGAAWHVRQAVRAAMQATAPSEG